MPPPPVLIGLTKEDDDEFEYVLKNKNFGQYWQYWHVRRKPIGDQQSTISAPTRSHIPQGVNIPLGNNISKAKMLHKGQIFHTQKYFTGENNFINSPHNERLFNRKKYSTGDNYLQNIIFHRVQTNKIFSKLCWVTLRPTRTTREFHRA